MSNTPGPIDEHPRDEPATLEHCLNCGAPLTGQYCARCGQRAKSRLISIWELVRDAFGDLFELDSRLWRTIIPLAIRPGHLTLDYLRGRRVRYMPPFRTYLVLSVVFFLVAFFDPQEQFGLLLGPEEPPVAVEEPVAPPGPAAEIRAEVLNELAAEGVDVGRVAPPDSRNDTDAPGADGNDAAIAGEEDIDAAASDNTAIAGDGNAGEAADARDADDGDDDVTNLVAGCDFSGMQEEELPSWLSGKETRDRLEAVCKSVTTDQGKTFLGRFLDNVPASLFVLLPLMALVLKILYPLSGRYYVEHLLFVLHYHAFFFLAMTVDILLSRIVTWTGLPGVLSGLTTFVLVVYIPVYLYKAMRRVYGQDRAITIFKFLMLVVSYFVGLGAMLLIVVFYTALSL